MDGLDRIINEIQVDAKAAADKILSDAEAKAERIISRAEQQAREIESEAEKKAELEYRRMLSRTESTGAVTVSRAVLREKQRIISEVLEAAAIRFGEAQVEEYFDFLTKLLDKYAEQREGEIILSERAKTWITPGFRSAISQKGLEISEKSHDFSGGFILVYGDTEENCTLEALLEAERDRLHDAISRFLF